MKGDVEVLFFNEMKKKATVDIQILGHISLVQEDASHLSRTSSAVFSEAALSLAEFVVRRVLATVLGHEGWQRVSFRADSLKLKDLSGYGAVPDPFHVAQLLAAAVLVSMLSDIDASDAEDDKPLLCEASNEDELYEFVSGKFAARLNEHAVRLRESFLERRSKEPHPLLLRAEALEKSGTLDQSFALIEKLNPEQLNSADYGKWCVLKLKVMTRLDLTDDGFQTNLKQYDEMRLKNRHDSEVVRELVCIWIRYLQNRRDFREALKEVNRFSQEFPESSLPPSERAIFVYLKGRNEYHDGEYIGALKLLDDAFSEADANDLEFRSDILNTAASAFTDNLFFDHAECLLREALGIREQLALAKKMETLSAMGCVALKRADFAEASKLFSRALREMRENGFIENESRILNYAAKAALFNGDFEKAFELIEEAARKADKKRSDIAFSNSIKMACLVRKGDFAAADGFFRETFMLPENHSEIFATAWGYFYEAEACYRLGRTQDALQYQARSIHFFLWDRYVLEAGLGGIVPILWDLSEAERTFFERLIENTDLLSCLMDYQQKHCDLPERFFRDFFNAREKAGGNLKPRLATFIEGIIKAAVTQCPEKTREIINAVCLL